MVITGGWGWGDKSDDIWEHKLEMSSKGLRNFLEKGEF